MFKIFLLFVILFGVISIGRYVYSRITLEQKQTLWSNISFSMISASIAVIAMGLISLAF